MATRGKAHTAQFMAWDTSANAPKTGDAANITPRYSKDGTSAALTTPTVAEVDATNFPGLYRVSLSATETDADIGYVGGKSATANVVIVPTKIEFERLPDAAPGASGGVARVQDLPAAAPTAADVATQVWANGTRTLTADTNLNIPTAGAIADAVWDEPAADHATAGTFGSRLDASVSGVSTGGVSAGDIATAVWAESARTLTAGTNLGIPTAGAIADAVWDEALSGHATAGTAGAALSAAEDGATGGAAAAYTGTIATASNGGTGGVGIATLNTPYPTASLAGHIVTVGGRTYEVATHTANQGAIVLREPWKAVPTAGNALTAEYLPDRLVSLQSITLPMRRLDTLTEANAADGLAAAVALAAGDKVKSGTSLTLKHLDGSTAATKTLDDATNPTSAT